MSKRKTVSAVIFVTFLVASTTFAAELKDEWNDFLHYTKIGRLDLARSYAQAIISRDPDPLVVLGFTLENPQGYEIMMMVHKSAPDKELAVLTEKLIAIIEQGRFVRRSDPKLVVDEVKRLSRGDRGKMIAMKRLKDAGEFAIPFMLDPIGNPNRRSELPHVIWALPQIGQPGIRPLAAALQTDNPAVKSEVINALGAIGYPQALPYLKYVVEQDESTEHKNAAMKSIREIDPSALSVSAAELFFKLAEKYYYHHASLDTVSKAGQSNIWFWDTSKRHLVWQSVSTDYFNELMAMRCCEWALDADPEFGRAIGLWLAGFYKAESYGTAMPAYFGQTHAKASVYATTAGPEYLHQALARAINDGNAAVALGTIEALIVTAGQKSIFSAVGAVQPLLTSLTFDDNAVRSSAAIAIATAGPRGQFGESGLVVDNLAKAIDRGVGANADQAAAQYGFRCVRAMLALANHGNRAFDLAPAQAALVKAVNAGNSEMKILSAQVLSHVDSPSAQQAVASLALGTSNDQVLRIQAFAALAVSAKLNGSQIKDDTLAQMYDIISSEQAPAELRQAAATAFGALNLPSRKVKDLILDQAKS